MLGHAQVMDIDRVLICCEDNAPSRATILGADGVLEDVRVGTDGSVERYWIALA